MYISEIIIDEFGGLKNRKISLNQGFNLITGCNESGKSSVAAFIKFIFYGFDDQKERIRCSSLDTGVASGSVVIEKNGEKFRIERSQSGNRSKVRIVYEDTGNELNDWQEKAKTPGDYFLGIPSQLYESSLYVSQAGGPAPEGGASEAVSNIVMSGDETTSLGRAKNSLDNLRKSLKLKKGSGGEIFSCEQNIASLKTRLENATKASETKLLTKHRIKETEEALEEKKKLAGNAKDELENERAMQAGYIAVRISGLDKKKQDLTDDLKKLDEEYSRLSFLPDDAYINDLRSSYQEFAAKKKAYEEFHSFGDFCSLPPKGYEYFENNGKRKELSEHHSKMQSRIGTGKLVLVISAIVFAVSLIAILLSVADVFSASIPFISVLAAISAISVAGTVVVLNRLGKSMKNFARETGITPTRTFSDYLSECEKYSSEAENYRLQNETAEKQTDSLKISEDNYLALLSKWDKKSFEEAEKTYRDYLEDKKKIKDGIAAAEAEISVLYAKLGAFSESDLKRAASADENLYRPENTAEIKLLSENLSKAESEVDLLEKQLSDLRITDAGNISESPDELAMLLDNEETKLSVLSEKYDSVMLAMQCLEEAETAIKNNFLPSIAFKAGECFRILTGGRYETLRLDEKLNISYERGSSITSSDYLSHGSAALAYVCLRLALHSNISRDEIKPLIFDETFVYFDDTRLGNVLSLLSELSGVAAQIILFSASDRESRLIAQNQSFSATSVNRIEI